MKVNNVVRTTTSRYEFNRAYKEYLERKGKIRCSYCMYHDNENDTGKYYCIDDDKTRYPNWKLSTNNKKQWMYKKNIKLVKKTYRVFGTDYFEIKF